jgi:TPR repeat protein
MAYASGDGVAQNINEASTWYNKAVEQNFPDAQYFMGEVYYHGRGVGKDSAKAQEWYSKAADQGHKGAKERLAQIAEERAGQ